MTDAPPPERLTLDRLPTPIGEALLVTDEAGRLRAVDFDSHADRMTRLLGRHYGRVTPEAGDAPSAVRGAIAAYFEGEVAALSALSWATAGTVFQRTVWAALTEIPVGETWSYGRLAAHIGAPKAMRAVGLANGANPVGVVVPCHRVIGADGSMTGYGGGIERKRWLLDHEARHVGAAPRLI
jgi:methylated-DNA-[protein]-cysteine S-methyltransferase